MKLLLFIAAVMMTTQVQARAPREMVEMKAGDPVVIRRDRAYLLFRTYRPDGVASIEPVLLRVPNANELGRFAEAKRAAFSAAQPKLFEARRAQMRKKQQAEAAGKPFTGVVPPEPGIDTFQFDYDGIANLQNIDDSKALIKGKPESTYLVEVIPGEFVLYGATFGSGILKPALHVCMCLGTVGFSARAGEVVDLGHFLGDGAKGQSKIPELKAETGFGPSSDSFIVLIAATVRPPTPGMAVPDILRTATIRPVEYRAVGKFFDPRATAINRLVPVSGVLAYNGGQVIDVKTGKVAADR